MSSGSSPYHSPRVAAGYAFARPPVHRRIMERIRERMRLKTRVARALDVGCGAGRSTAALQPLARAVVGIDPAIAMLEHRRQVAPGAGFLVARAEHLPFPRATFDLIAAAGAINYADPALALPEIARVLAPRGAFVIYDFSAGRRFADGPALDAWFEEFARRYPDAPGYAMDVRQLPFQAAGLVLEDYGEFSIAVPMDAGAYGRYAMSETRVELAVTGGADETSIRVWCRETLEPIFGLQEREVIFDAYTAFITTRGS